MRKLAGRKVLSRNQNSFPSRYESMTWVICRAKRMRTADSGSGISREILPHVFDLFVQEGADGAGTRSGLGIGLALARRLVEMHGGTIDAASPGRGLGSVLTISLPVSAAPEAALRVDSNGDRPPVSRRVLVVDDNRDAADSMAQLVAGMGSEARVAYDGPAGVAEAEAFRPEIVFLDIGMPGLDGYETCRCIRRALGPGATLVALSGWGQEQDKEAARAAGFDAHLTKPADPATLGRFLRSER